MEEIPGRAAHHVGPVCTREHQAASVNVKFGQPTRALRKWTREREARRREDVPPKKGSAGDGVKDTARGGGNKLVIVESPAKAKTIAGYLGPGYIVESSIGPFRDLPNKAAEIPARYKDEPWARLGVNVDRDFEPLYVVNADKKAQVKRLKELLAEADELYLATDEDREGEAIAWHLREELKPTIPVKRMVFNEITKEAIRHAAQHTRDLNLRLVDAQETRRILDRLYGYEVSPVLWKKVMPSLSAGRVQSVATRLVVERERERIAFTPAEYWGLKAVFAVLTGTDGVTPDLPGTLYTVDGDQVAKARLHLPRRAALPWGARRTGRRADSRNAWPGQYTVRSVERKPYRRSPYAPFRTTTAAGGLRKLGLSASRPCGWRSGNTRTATSPTCAPTAPLSEALSPRPAPKSPPVRRQHLPDKPRTYTSKVKNAQEAHGRSARPATLSTPAETGLSGVELRLYELIWKRTIASQMKDAVGESLSVRVAGTSTAGEQVEFSATGEDHHLPRLPQSLRGRHRRPAGRTRRPGTAAATAHRRRPAARPKRRRGRTQHPAARPLHRGVPSQRTGRARNRPPLHLRHHHRHHPGTRLRVQEGLRACAVLPGVRRGPVAGAALQPPGRLRLHRAHGRRARRDCPREAERVPWLRRFYFGADGQIGLKELVNEHLGDIDPKEISSFPLPDSDIVLRVGRYGPYLERNGQRVNVPDDLAPDELTKERAEELFAQPNGDRELGKDPETGRTIVAKNGRFGPYVTEVIEETEAEAEEAKPKGRKKTAAPKPRTASLLKSMSLETITLEDALKLLSLPRVVGEIDGEQVTAQNGRFGPYLKKGSESRSLETEEQLFTVTIEEAKELFAQPKKRRTRAAAPPLRELGPDPVTGKPMVIKEGRFGPYVTDGESNASLRKGDDVESLTPERAAELLAERRAKAPAKKTTSRTTTRKTTKSTAKKA